MPGHEFTQRNVDRVALRSGAYQALGFPQDVVVDVDVRPHTHKLTPPGV
jgi:hypothetical protein